MVRFREHDSTKQLSKKDLLSKILNHRVPADLSVSAALNYLSCLDCPRALTVAILLRNKEYEQLCKLEFDPSHHLAHDEMHMSYCATFLFKKYQDFKIPGIDRRELAREKLLTTEVSCWKTNQIFKHNSPFSEITGKSASLHHAIKRKIELVLGDLDVDEMLEAANWGPGASSLIKRRFASAANKFQNESGITRDLYDVINSAGFFSDDGFSPLWSKVRKNDLGRFSGEQDLLLRKGDVELDLSCIPFCVGNKVDFVPKTSLIDRPIAIEPGINLWFQKALGTMIRRRLRRVGINLNSQKRNQLLAKFGSIWNQLCTVDFSSASDTIAIELVRELLPPRWFLMMDICRSHFGDLDGTQVRWQKFSSMGNGFTFELQSLIFFAVAISCCEYHELCYKDRKRVSVYGDDVIIPQAAYGSFLEMSTLYGFTVNPEKTFVSSDFRESCGEHYFRGVSVKPIYLKGRIRRIPQLFRFHNAIRRNFHSRGSLRYCDRRFKKCCDFLANQVPKSCRIWIPETLGDGGLIGNFDEATPVWNRDCIAPGTKKQDNLLRNDWEGFNVLNLVESARTLRFDGDGLILSQLWLLEQRKEGMTLPGARSASAIQTTDDFTALIPLRGSTKFRVAESCVRSWYDLGPWL